MDDQIQQVIQEKLLDSAQNAPGTGGMTRREERLPSLKNKAFCVIGMRRAGKTTYLHQCRADLTAEGRAAESLVYFNFEDERLGDLVAADLHWVPEAQARLFPTTAGAAAGTGVTFFFDEIQRVPGWEVFARRMLDTPGVGLFLSGSSAKLLSRDIATSMRGRAWEVAIYPFSFSEFLAHHGSSPPTAPDRLTSQQRAGLDHQFGRYLAVGGFPEAQPLGTGERRILLQGYVDTVMLRDVIERHGVANVPALRHLVRRLLGSPASLFSVQKICEEMKSHGIAAGREMLHAQLGHLEDAFLLHTVPIATDSEKRRLVNPRKCYPADPGLLHAWDRSGRANTGHVLETAVCVELLRRRCELGYVKTADGWEVDFLARGLEGGEQLIQVAASVDNPDTLAREVRALQAATALHPRAEQLILTAESRLPMPAVPAGIRIVPAWQWMLNGPDGG